MQEGNKFIKGTLILTIAGVIVKVLGAVYRIPLMRILGEEGMGLFMAAYPIYAMMLSISTAGVPVAVSKLVAEKLAQDNYVGARQVFRVALSLMVASGLLVTGVLLLGASYYTTHVLRVPGVLYPLLAIAPSITFFAMKSAFRGYFQGQQRMIPTAISQITEQIVRVGTIFVLAIILVEHSLELGAAGAAFGSVTGAAVALAMLILIYYRQSKNRDQALDSEHNALIPTRTVLKQILALALPITVGSIVVPLVSTVDSALVLPRLQAGGFTQAQASALFGSFSGGAMPLVNAPTIFTIAIATSLVPAIADAYSHRNKRLIQKLSSLSVRIGMFIGFPAALGLFLLAEPISVMLYKSASVARPLSVAAFSVIFISLNQTTAPVLQGLGKTYLPVSHMFTGLIIKIVLNYFLTAIPSINILGPAFGTIVAFAVASFLNLRSIAKYTGGGFPIINSFLKPLLNAALMGVVVYLAYPPIFKLVLASLASAISSDSILTGIAVLLVIGLGVGVYGVSTLLTGTITRSELLLVPKVGAKAEKILTRFGLLRR